jgi:hypothetical protein
VSSREELKAFEDLAAEKAKAVSAKLESMVTGENECLICWDQAELRQHYLWFEQAQIAYITQALLSSISDGGT